MGKRVNISLSLSSLFQIKPGKTPRLNLALSLKEEWQEGGQVGLKVPGLSDSFVGWERRYRFETKCLAQYEECTLASAITGIQGPAPTQLRKEMSSHVTE